MKSITVPLLLASASALALACSDPAQGVAAAEVDGPSTAEPAAPAASGTKAPQGSATAPAAGALAVTPANSSIEFEGSKVTGSHVGGFRSFTGSVQLAGDAPEGAKVHVDIDTTSIFADSDRLVTHLKDADFFDVQRFPKATFVSTQVRAGGEGDATHTIVGKLTLRGLEKTVAFPANLTVTPAKVSATAEFSINRKDFGIVYAGKPDNLIRDLVVLRLKLELPRGG